MITIIKWLIAAVLLFCTIAKSDSTNGVTYQAALGRQGADCAGRGVCSFVETADGFNARLSFSPTDSNLTVQLLNSRFSTVELDRQIAKDTIGGKADGSGFFVMESDYVLPGAMKERLQIPQTLYRIPQGRYGTTEQNGQTIIQFKIK
jgi:hypothetical protein